jgi:hypothetical protein
MRVKAYTYRITNTLTHRWYYGVKYDAKCDTDALGTTYFSSSNKLCLDIEKFGKENFKFEIRKIFDCIETAKKYEIRVLKRFKPCKDHPFLYNEHATMGFIVMSGDSNPSKRCDVREKLSIKAKNRTPEAKALAGTRSKETKFKKKVIGIIYGKISPKLYILISTLDEMKNRGEVKYKFIIRKLETLISSEKERRRIKREQSIKTRGETIGKAKKAKNKKAYTSPDGKFKFFGPDETVPSGWIVGAKDEVRTEKIRKSSTGRGHSDETKQLLSEQGRKKIYFTSPDLCELVVVYNLSDAPDGWIRGNKLKTRSEKISKEVAKRHEKNRKN